MRKETKIFKCPICDTVVEVLESCGLEMTCCGPEMVPLRENICGKNDPHMPIIERMADGIRISVGNPLHDMNADHCIAWIEVLADGMCYRQFLRAGDKPQAMFKMDSRQPIVARVYCNSHGLWRAGDSTRGTKKARATAQEPQLACV
ncbi:MAG: desulfoferrodoxin [Planctomycetaceae bacterium]|nr:MAG: desulfoferrodoxin [Planctomycetaceae bacterium]